MNDSSRNYHRHPEFNEHLLKSRLSRVSVKELESFFSNFKVIEDISKNKEKLVREIVQHYLIMKQNNDFMSKFGCFIRDFVLGANESENLIEISEDHKPSFIHWINTWDNNIFIGKKFNFYKNVYLELGQKFLVVSRSKEGENIKIVNNLSEDTQINQQAEDIHSLSFPSSVFFLVAYNQDKKTFFSVDQLVEIHQTYEFEIILRKNSPLVSVRGDQSVLKDFLSSAIEDSQNQLSMVQSLVVGDFNDKRNKTLVQPRKTIKIEELRQSINGHYLDISAPIAGDQVTRAKLSLKCLQNPLEETHPVFGPALTEAWKEQENSRIGFSYNGKTYTFFVTRTGGLYFRAFTPEEVITYILLKISNI